jgi:hypothetical protein
VGRSALSSLAADAEESSVSFWKGCAICGPYFFHRWWCPTLLRTLDVLAGTSIVIVAAVALSGSSPSIGWPGALLMLAGSLVADLGIRAGLWRRRRASPEAKNSSEDRVHQRVDTLEGRWIAFLRGPWSVSGAVATFVAYFVLVLTLGFGLATLFVLCLAAAAAIGLVVWRRSIKRRKASGTWPYR